MSFAQNIKKYRLQKGLTQEGLAALLVVSPQAVSKWERGECYPDGALLLPLSVALECSLDSLFESDVCSIGELSSKIGSLLRRAPENARIHRAASLCWQIEKGLFGCFGALGEDPQVEFPAEEGDSHILTDDGFTSVSCGAAPFFAVFPEPEGGFAEAIGDGEDARKIFAALASPETLRALLWIHQREGDALFEAAVLGRECEIADEKLDGVLRDLLSLGVVLLQRAEIDGERCTLYKSVPSHKLIALLLLAGRFRPRERNFYEADRRKKPYLSPAVKEDDAKGADGS